MSSYLCKIKVIATGEIFQASALDDYFGKHQYGYRVDDGRRKKVYRQEEIEEIV